MKIHTSTLKKQKACKMILNSFNLAGEKLIEHLKHWLEPEKLMRPDSAWAPGDATTIAAAILNLFSLLPPQAVQFLETKGASHPPPWARMHSACVLSLI